MAIRFLFLQSDCRDGITPRNVKENMNAIIIHVLVSGFLAGLVGCASMGIRSTNDATMPGGQIEALPTVYSTMSGGGMNP